MEKIIKQGATKKLLYSKAVYLIIAAF